MGQTGNRAFNLGKWANSGAIAEERTTITPRPITSTNDAKAQQEQLASNKEKLEAQQEAGDAFEDGGIYDGTVPGYSGEWEDMKNVWGTKTRPITEKDFDKFVKSMSKTLGFDVEDAAIHIFTPLMAGSGSTANMVVSIGKSGIIISNKGRVVKQYSSAYLAKLAASRKASKSAASDLPSTNIGSNLPVIKGTSIKQAGATKNLDFSKVCSGTVCFTAGTLIHTIHGTKPIETIERSELVWSREEFGDKYDYRPVIDTKVTPNVAIFEVKIKHDNGLEETFNTTEEHPFWIDGEGWRKASVLEAGMKLLDKNGKATATIISQTALDKNETVYNFEVQDFHTYHIGEIGLWVHNANCCDFTDNWGAIEPKFKAAGWVDSKTNKVRYLDPFDGKLKNFPDDVKPQVDHVLPRAEAKRLAGKDLTTSELNNIINSSDNLMPIPGYLNGSKGSKVEYSNGGWVQYGNKGGTPIPINAEYKAHILEIQKDIRLKILKAIEVKEGK
ncbi:polymorphic toxin-type HINT domain-containing protein [Psychrobacter sp. M13]|uniref:polymorphic toxin-type HINT domain-containing protein n=1 Tax=Psychrobacter sp. M13 TaxID=3067275 RepID=UPI00273B7770|nr:polymorphic toxin-type HINT domain-containing protein [Psychrobacter sp. M13]WLP95289.1 polymorphic toxin-type HINT domain-containing protein [Psychrobacter sp. M13]